MDFENEIEASKGVLFSYFLKKTNDLEQTKDLYQETVIRAINQIEKGNYRDDGKFRKWIYKVANSVFIDWFRKNRTKEKTVCRRIDHWIYNYIEDETPNKEAEIEKEHEVQKLKKAILRLPPEQQTIVKLRIYQEKSFKEIAEETEVSINTALGRMRYAIINLRKQMER